MEERAIYQASDKGSSLRQGEILTGVIQYKPVVNELLQGEQELSFDAILHPYAIVVTQDCDLDWDYRARQAENSQPAKLLNSIILCEIGTAELIRTTDGINRKEWELVVAHRHERFYFFEKIPPEYEVEQEGLPEIAADFKRVFGIDAATLYRQIELGMVKRRAILASPYLEHFSRRYYSFHGRVALPFQYESEREG
ncbi:MULTISPECIES: hypothetical protein [unclassified Synechocystis]|uniref:hypothetical protein n=1 Tax=unclassified Synechocystis TaxID=2640012 RepID=UPI00041A0439|nr:MULTISPECIES: hypothetical protein [unclassified Synechocystis]AIE72586.1 hypothetical protein D082_00570 [Synechocystis sp. PCC 6714]MCT0254505.1 hypothetical protein [Synechocystis sp. CS-94]